MKKQKIGEFEYNFILPDDLDSSISVNKNMNDWINLIKKERIKKLKEERIKKLNKINGNT
jgi:hypothetical protein